MLPGKTEQAEALQCSHKALWIVLCLPSGLRAFGQFHSRRIFEKREPMSAEESTNGEPETPPPPGMGPSGEGSDSTPFAGEDCPQAMNVIGGNVVSVCVLPSEKWYHTRMLQAAITCRCGRGAVLMVPAKLAAERMPQFNCLSCSENIVLSSMEMLARVIRTKERRIAESC